MSYSRYPEYKESGVEWLGEIPAHWETIPTKRAVTLDIKKSSHPENYVGMENIESGTGKYIPSDSTPEGAANIFKAGQILFGKLRPYLRKSWNAEFDGSCSSELLTMTPRRVTSEFFHNFTLTDEFTTEVNSSTYGSKMPRASWDFIGDLKVPLPPLPEQRQIAAFLDRECAAMDTLMAKQERLIALLAEKRQALISHTVTKGLDPHAPLKDSGIEWPASIPQNWNISQLGKQLTLQRGVDITKDEQNEGEVPVVSSGGISSFHNHALVKGPNVVVGRKGTAGSVHWIESDFWPHDTTLFISNLKNNNTRFIYYKLLSLDLPSFDSGSSNPTLNRNRVHPHPVSWPSNQEEQRAIVAYLDEACGKIDTLVAKAESTITLLKERRTALISAAVTGKIDVREH